MITNRMDNPRIRSETHGPVSVVTIDYPEKRNSLSDPVLSDLVDAMTRADREPGIRAIVLTGSPKVFASGADVAALLERSTAEAFEGERSRAWESLRRVKTPTVSAVSGFCLGGGCELALGTDVIVASESARFGLPETRLGLIPGAGGTQMLPRLVGKALAMDLVLTGRMLGAAEALQQGLVSRVSTVDDYLDDAVAIAEEIANRPAIAQRLAKQVIDESLGTDLETGIANERKAFAVAFGSKDAREGMSAFLEGREPTWTHD